MLATVVKMLSVNVNPYLVGPAGSGKSTIARQAAEALNRPYYSKGACMAAYELTGTINAHGDYNPTDLYKWFTEGGVFCFDEIDAYHPRALVALNELLANDLFGFPNGMQKKHKDAVAIAGANTIGLGANRQYVGRAQLDGATLDRFVQVEIHYDENLETALANSTFTQFGGTDLALMTEWLSLVRKVRAKLATMGSQAIVSPRASINGAKLLAAGMTAQQITPMILTKHLSKDEKAQVSL
jgi:MoxR-like ATPase